MQRYKQELTQKIGQWLLEEKKGPSQKDLAKSLGIDPRTLRNWKKKAREHRSPVIGRPSYTSSERIRAMILVCRELRKQGYPGSPAVYQRLKGKVPRRMVNEYVKTFKTRHLKRKREILIENRTSIEVLKKNVIWSQDGTHLGRIRKTAIEAQVIKDRGSLSTIGIQVGITATESEVLNQLKLLKQERSLPLVWMTDNGSAYIGNKLVEFLKNEQVIHLRSAPRVPQHNAAAEKNMCELKKASLLGKGVSLVSIEEGFARLTRAADQINTYRPRYSKGYKTANELETELSTAHRINRKMFYNKCMKTLKTIEESNEKRRVPIKKRDAVFSILSDLKLITINRGVRGCVYKKAEVLL